MKRRGWNFLLAMFLVVGPFVVVLTRWHFAHERERFRFMVEIGNIEAVKRRLDAGMDINMDEGAGYTPLEWVAYKGYPIEEFAGQQARMVRFLLEHGARGRRALSWAVQRKNLEIAKALLERGTNFAGLENQTPLEYAKAQGFEELVEHLEAAKSNAVKTGRPGK